MIFGEFDAHPEFLHFRCLGHNCVGLPNGWGGIKRVVIISLGYLFFQRVQTCFASFLWVQTGVRVRLSADWNRVFMAGTGVLFVNGVLCVEFRKGFCKECFEFQVWLSFPLLFGDLLSCLSNRAGRSGVFLRVVCFCASLLLYWGFVAFGRVKDRRDLVS